MQSQRASCYSRLSFRQGHKYNDLILRDISMRVYDGKSVSQNLQVLVDAASVFQITH